MCSVVRQVRQIRATCVHLLKFFTLIRSSLASLLYHCGIRFSLFICERCIIISLIYAVDKSVSDLNDGIN